MLSGLCLALGAPLMPEQGGAPPLLNTEVLVAPRNLFTEAQQSFATTEHVDFRANWEIAQGRLSCLGVSNNDARLVLDTPLTAGRPYFCKYDLNMTSSTLKINLGGAGAATGRGVNSDWQNFEYYPAPVVSGSFTRAQVNPSSGFEGSIDEFEIFDLSTVDPNIVASDIILIGGDSNASNATSEYVTAGNREAAFDPRIWYMPCLRSSPNRFGLTGSVRHIPQPAIEPIQTASGARRMSPQHAAAAELVDWSAARGRPLLIMSLGDAGSGLMNTEDWRKSSSAETTGSRMWNEMVAMKAAVDALGPDHQIIGAIWSLGANDTFGGEYEINHGATYSEFFADVRSDVADVPMVLINLGAHYEPLDDGRGADMRSFLRRFDRTSGDPRSVSRMTVVEPPVGQQLDPNNNGDPHFTASGIQANGRVAGAALRLLLETEG